MIAAALVLQGAAERDAEPKDDTLELPALPARGEEPRIEHFLLELPVARGVQTVGALRWIARRQGNRVEFEWELDFPAENLRLLAVELLGPDGARLTWRELQGSTSRSLVVEWSPTGKEIVLRDWARDGALRETRSVASGAVMPLYLLELARAGSLAHGEFPVFMPTERALAHLELSTKYLLGDGAETGVPQGSAGRAVREVELRRGDGSLAGRYRFRGEELASFEWQENGIRGRRVEREAYEQALEAPKQPIVFAPQKPTGAAVPGQGEPDVEAAPPGAPIGGR